jgi:hypothetical protein
VKIREVHARGEVIFYRQIFSSSSSLNTAIGFKGVDNEFGAILVIESISSRLIDPFSFQHAIGRREFEYLHPPFTPFLVTEA